jgi:uncharacterized protein (DUF362 family)
MGVSIFHNDSLAYPLNPPFDPDQIYPEMENFAVPARLNPANKVYAAIRELLHDYGYDLARYGTQAWNPFQGVVEKGQRVVIKPNLVLHENKKNDDTCLITHGAVIRPIIDYVYLATGGKCEVVICDVPLQEADFEKIIEQSRIGELVEFYKRTTPLNIRLLDLRKERIRVDDKKFIIERIALQGDPEGYTVVNLGRDSDLEKMCEREDSSFSVSNYDYKEARKHHSGGKHEYLVANTILNADVFINVPKLKTHQKTGLTVSLKNLIGINGDKSWLPHYVIGGPAEGGDEYPSENNLINSYHARFRRTFQAKNKFVWSTAWFVWQIAKKALKTIPKKPKIACVDGAWSGNDTLWRTIMDLNKIIFFAEKNSGRLQETQQRKYIAIVDGIVSGEGNGPLFSTRKRTGIAAISEDPLALDVVCAHLMGLKWEKIRKLSNACLINKYNFSSFKGDTDKLAITLNGHSTTLESLPNLDFRVAPGWEDIKREKDVTAKGSS